MRSAPMPDRRQLSVEDTLRRLVAEIAASDYRDHLGHRLTMNTAYLDAVTLLDIRDLLERPPPAGD